MDTTPLYSDFEEVTREEQIDISTTSQVIANRRDVGLKRKVLVVLNNSDNEADIIFVSFGSNKKAELNKGIKLKKGASFTDANSEGYLSYQGQINAICETINGKILVFER